MEAEAKLQVIRSVFEMQATAIQLRSKGRLVGLVPTMGSLHQGHLSLIEAAKKQADKVVVSIFVNPTQFSPNEDFNHYPRDLNRDVALCEEAGVDYVFAPSEEEMYPKGYSTFISEEDLSSGLCGMSRPNHFRGVLTIVAKLFNAVLPDLAVFGQKDSQQAAVIRKMVSDLHFCVDIVVVPTIREEDGLAMSSRNGYLSTQQRKDAAIIYQSLEKGKALVDNGTTNADRVVAEVTHGLLEKRRIRVIYVKLVNRRTLQPVREIEPGNCMIAVAAWVDEVRLIDNILL
ncbi:MAG: pantoate--beta-alanine ligase [Opitutales bacterium]